MPRYYHISQDFTDDVLVLHPRVYWASKQIGEPLIPRICVAPSPEQCAWSISFDGALCATAIYYVDTDEAVRAHDVFDLNVTDEHWCLKDTVFYKLCDLPSYDINIPSFDVCESGMLNNYAKKSLRKLKKYYKRIIDNHCQEG